MTILRGPRGHAAAGWRRLTAEQLAILGRREFLKYVVASAGMAGLGSLAGCASVDTSGPADILIVNGRIATLDSRKPTVSALAVKADRVIATGSDASSRICAVRRRG